ncbi:carbonic anhydrase [Caldalkalibacillus uzonensis]|uniref:carbonic anhydrase n=1 Tax=Caldalkalibacillus uzonensis TaxID=353224 RepID=A0ABU0CUX2_9BACI|nr:carbonic anhydrase [Caldalkalibacillus uzonensis]MDQ0340124.1 carbonic anhydrase [Caldalkalibacillus uzonensis]
MTLLSDILSFNEQFVQNKEYERFRTTKFPNKKMVILTCMDTRLLELLPRALNLKNGDAKIIKNAGAVISHPYGSIMRSILVALYELRAKEVLIIGHHDCGMAKLNANSLLEKAKERGVTEKHLNQVSDKVDLKQWLTGFNSVEESVAKSVEMVKSHPLFPADVPVHGLVIDPETGRLDLVVNGYEKHCATEL